jgi:hypothetical protein
MKSKTVETISTRKENELERKYGIFLVPESKKPKKCETKRCMCDEFRLQDEEGICKGNRYEKRLRTKKLQEKMEEADLKREENLRKQEEKENKLNKKHIEKDVSIEDVAV